MPIANESADDRTRCLADFLAGATPGLRSIRTAFGYDAQRDFRHADGTGRRGPCSGNNNAGHNRTRYLRLAGDTAGGASTTSHNARQSVRRSTGRPGAAGRTASDAAANLARNRTRACDRSQSGAAA